MDFKVNQIVMETRVFKNGNKSRTVGVISKIEESEKGKGKYHVILLPLPEKIAKPIRDQYCTEEYNHQGIKNCYADQYGFASHTISKENTIVIGWHNVSKGEFTHWNPKPGDTGYDLMC